MACSVSLLSVLALAPVKPPEAPATATPGSAASIGAGAGATAAAPPAAAAPAATGPSSWPNGNTVRTRSWRQYWTDPYAPAFLKSKLWRESTPADAALMKKIADNGGADWIGDWTPHVGNWVSKRVNIILKTGALPLFIAYNMPKRDCGQYSAGGARRPNPTRPGSRRSPRGSAIAGPPSSSSPTPSVS